MPNLSPTMEQGNLVQWYKKEGDLVKEGEALASVETDKSTLDFEMVEDSWLAKIIVPAGTNGVKIGTPVCIMVDSQSDVAAFADYKDEPNSKQASATSSNNNTEVKQQTNTTPQHEVTSAQTNNNSSSHDRVFASPLARKTARDLGVDISSVKGTGPNGRVVAADLEGVSKVQQVEEAPKKSQVSSTQATTTSDYEDLPVTNIRKIVAKRLTESKTTIPHYYLSIEAEVDAFLQLRERLNKQSAVKISVNDMIIKAAALACIRVPECNSSWQGEFIRRYKNADVSIAAQTEHGLITPIVPSANLKGLSTIATETKELVAKAQANKLKPHEFQGGTFSISNLGMFGIDSFCAIINPPHACNLAVGTTNKKVVEREGGFQ